MGAVTRALADLSWPRRTERLTLRPARLADVDALYAYRSDPDVARWLTAVATSPDEVAVRFLGGGSSLVVEHDGVVVGDLMLRVDDAWSQSEVRDQAEGAQAEVGWCLSPRHRGRGYAVEAVREVVTVAFELGVRRVVAMCFADNLASRRVMERVGLRQEGYYVGESLHRDGTWRDAMSFAVLAEEWAEQS